jgi:aminopeptidase YwaD
MERSGVKQIYSSLTGRIEVRMKMNMSVLCLSLVAVGLLSMSAPTESLCQGSTQDITASEIQEHVKYLASDELQGRGSGSEGNMKAAIYIASKLKLWGLKAAGDNGTYFQPFDFISSVKLGSGNSVVVKGLPSGVHKLRLDIDFRPFGFSASEVVIGPLVFAGYGITAPDQKYDDYEGLDVKGKIVVAFRYAPDGSGNQSSFARYSSPRNKARVARDKGAAALILITGPADDADDDLQKLSVDQGAGSSGLPVISMKRTVIDEASRHSGKELRAVQDSIRSTRKPISFEFSGVTINIETSIEKVMSQTSNVIAYLEGNDPVLKDEVLILGAHLDHLGLGGKGSGSMVPDTIAIHNGADDNASGTAALLELAQAIGARSGSIKRSFLFIFFSGEELGTLGSQHYVSTPFYPIAQSIAMLNLDMVGRMQGKSLSIGGSGTSPAWEKLLRQENADSTFSLSLSPDGFGPSDHASFYAKDIPVLFFFTGVHDDYHKPTDDWEKLDYRAEEKIVRYVYRIASDIDAMPQKPGFLRVQLAAGSRGGAGDTKTFSVTLGIVPDVGESSSGMKISGVKPNGPAEKAGLKSGDVIVKMAGKTVMNIYDYMGMLGELKAGDEIEVEVMREGKPVKLRAVMQKRN